MGKYQLVFLGLGTESLFLKCPMCGGKLAFDVKLGEARCLTCGWTKIIEG
jgi:hypothetical protein